MPLQTLIVPRVPQT